MTKREEILETWLYNAILSWYDDAMIEYKGLDDEDFINRVCDFTGMSVETYKDLMNI